MPELEMKVVPGVMMITEAIGSPVTTRSPTFLAPGTMWMYWVAKAAPSSWWVMVSWAELLSTMMPA